MPRMAQMSATTRSMRHPQPVGGTEAARRSPWGQGGIAQLERDLAGGRDDSATQGKLPLEPSPVCGFPSGTARCVLHVVSGTAFRRRFCPKCPRGSFFRNATLKRPAGTLGVIPPNSVFK
ncbi:unnamed protein product [Lampetra fluviatilis]